MILILLLAPRFFFRRVRSFDGILAALLLVLKKYYLVAWFLVFGRALALLVK